MKKHLIQLGIALLVLFLINPLAAQNRSPQIELFGGAAFPLSPDGFKDYYKVGGSIHGQYVIFPSPNMGISFGAAFESFAVDEDAILAGTGLTSNDVTIDASANIGEFGVGVRPYLTPVTASNQIYLFGMATFNVVNAKSSVTYTDFFGNEVTDEFDESENKFGVAAGGGLEFPAGSSFNSLLQGLVRFIFTSDEFAGGTLSFVGVTAGVAF